ncbi:hypothetical protein Tsubulata_037608 [Turnera subulata]|uniref:DUF4283 domain-containing protein n=1 Tax=Turnera subulata TaxID=218843 RepID=A0A9Q0FHH1_9ROSI|nr:hypothetical protein Tsubulata_037608 [Turnera subulata]
MAGNRVYEVYETVEKLQEELAKYISTLSKKFIAKKGVFTVVLSGGYLIDHLCKLVEAPYVNEIDWSKWYIFWVDERAVGWECADSNYKLANEGFLSKFSIPAALDLLLLLQVPLSTRFIKYRVIPELSSLDLSAPMADTSKLVIDLRDDESEYVPSEEASLGSLVARTYVVGKVYSDRKITPNQMRQQLKDIWYIKGDFKVIPKPNNIFLLGFEMEEDKKHVLKGSPWLVSNLHLCLKPWTQEMILSWQGFIRARFEFEVAKPLRPDIHGIDKNGKEIWIKFKYERLGSVDGDDNKKEPTSTNQDDGDHDISVPRDLSLAPPQVPNSDDGKNENSIVRVPCKCMATKTPTISPIHEAAKEKHAEIVNTMAAIVEELDAQTPVQASASKPSWKELARTTKVYHRATAEELVRDYEMSQWAKEDEAAREEDSGDVRFLSDSPPAAFNFVLIAVAVSKSRKRNRANTVSKLTLWPENRGNPGSLEDSFTFSEGPRVRLFGFNDLRIWREILEVFGEEYQFQWSARVLGRSATPKFTAQAQA